MALAGLKGMPARGSEFLPAKVAEVHTMNMAERPTLQDMIKSAMAGTVARVNVNDEAARQLAVHQGEDPEKVASVDDLPDHYTTDHIEKMASALDYIAGEIKVADEGNVQQPGQGPGALDVLEATSSEENIDAGEAGRAITQHLPKDDPPQQKEEVQVGKANTGMETNDGTMHPEQPVKPIVNQNASITPANPLSTPTTQTKESSVNLGVANFERLKKVAEKQRDLNKSEKHYLRRAAMSTPLSAAVEAEKGKKLRAFGGTAGHLAAETGKGMIGGALAGLGVNAGIKALKKGKLRGMDPSLAAAAGSIIGGDIGSLRGNYGRKASELHGKYSKNKEAGVDVALIRKLAEDALSPAGIEAGKQDMPDYSASEQSVPAQPADVKRQARSMLGSNEAAIGYTKQEAKADPIGDVNQVLAQPAMTRKNDPVLHKVLDNTGAAGVKISSVNDSVKVAAARALLSNMMDKAAAEKEEQSEDKKKEKASQMGAAPSSPSAASGFTASSLS
jgi:hypothetical protein